MADTGGSAASAENPVVILAMRLFGRASILVLLAVFNSIMAASIACTTASTRVFYAMGREGSLPGALAVLHPRYKTPVNAIWLQTAITLAVGLGVGFWIGPDQEYYFLGVTLGLILVYAAGNVGVMLDYGLRRRAQFHLSLHCAFPVASAALLLWAGYRSVVPSPEGRVRFAPLLTAVWILAGVCFTLRRNAGRKA